MSRATPPLADLAENPVRAAARAVERGAVERGGQPLAALVTREIVEALVGVLGRAEAREEARGFFRVARADGAARRGGGGEVFQALGGCAGWGVAGGGVTVPAVGFRFRRQIHLGVGGVEERELAGQAFLEEMTRDGSGFIQRRESMARERQARGRGAGTGAVAGSLPAGFHLRGEIGFGARAANLGGDEAAVGVEGVGDAAEESERGSLHGRKGTGCRRQ